MNGGGSTLVNGIDVEGVSLVLLESFRYILLNAETAAVSSHDLNFGLHDGQQFEPEMFGSDRIRCSPIPERRSRLEKFRRPFSAASNGTETRIAMKGDFVRMDNIQSWYGHRLSPPGRRVHDRCVCQCR